jgi:hypothetical protein
MNKHILTLIIAGMLSSLTFHSFGQERGDTDYTNNRTKGKGKKESQVNTKQKTPVKIIQYIPGTWEVEQVLRGQKDVSETDTLAKNQRLEFNREGRYMSYSGTEMIDSGAYRLNEDHAILYLQSDVEEKTSEWNVWFDKSGNMTLIPKDPLKGETLSYTYRRTANATSSNRD